MVPPLSGGLLAALIFASADYDGLELRTMAQACLNLVGESRLAQVLNAGQDPHLMMAANMVGLDYETAVKRHKEEKNARSARVTELIKQGLDKASAGVRAGKEVPAPVDDARQAGKVADFGFPGGLGPKTLVLFARKSYKVVLGATQAEAEEKAKWLKGVWLATFPEFVKYFARVNDLMGPDGATFSHFYSNRVRGNSPYCATCNSFFQGLGADATGNACFLVSEACYTQAPCYGCQARQAGCVGCWGTGISALYGTRLVNYVHDEFILECEEERGHEVAHELVRVMVRGAAPFLPDVPARAEPKLMRFWSKDAKQVWENDRLVAWPKAA
jgi:hypothetical protein